MEHSFNDLFSYFDLAQNHCTNPLSNKNFSNIVLDLVNYLRFRLK